MIALSFALPEESKDFVRRLRHARRSGPAALPVVAGTLAGREVIVVHTGIGMASASRQLGAFLEAHSPSLLIASGFGGALSDDLKVGDIVVAQNFSSPSLLGVIATLPARSGVLITTKTAVETAVKKQDLARHTGAIVVDMETAAIQRLCTPRDIPVLAVRSISDTAAQDLPIPSEIWFDAKKQRPRPISLLLHLTAHPSRIGPFVRFVRGINRARARLTDFLLAALDLLPKN